MLRPGSQLLQQPQHQQQQQPRRRQRQQQQTVVPQSLPAVRSPCCPLLLRFLPPACRHLRQHRPQLPRPQCHAWAIGHHPHGLVHQGQVEPLWDRWVPTMHHPVHLPRRVSALEADRHHRRLAHHHWCSRGNGEKTGILRRTPRAMTSASSWIDSQWKLFHSNVSAMPQQRRHFKERVCVTDAPYFSAAYPSAEVKQNSRRS
mmetsp:Transcript_31887/g.101318  ORF Transcript_31887/g.101318 Transcript_31887/m.101318 type:complete len:202 (-) Transcript_31887:16-621(-)